MEFTCMGCPTRHPSCHSECEKYLAEKKAHEERLENERQRKSVEQGLYMQRRTGVENAKRRAKYAKKYF